MILRKFDLVFLVTMIVVLSSRKNQGNARSEDVLLLQQRRGGFQGSPRPYGMERPTRVEEFNRTDVIHPEYQIPATLQSGNVSKFYYLSPRDGLPLTLLVTPCSGPISWTVSSVVPPDDDNGARSQTAWLVNTLISGSPLFTYEGEDAQNFTIPKVRAGLYRLEIKSLSKDEDGTHSSPNTVLLYATSSDLDHLPSSRFSDSFGNKHRPHTLRFQQRRRRRRLTVSWSKSQVDPHLSSYCLAVTSGSTSHPRTLCAARNLLKSYSRTSSKGPSKEHQHRGVPEGLHCVHQTKLTLHGLKYNATYNFTLYVVSTRNNVSMRVASEMIRFRRTPAQTLRTGRYATVDLLKNDGFINFRYRPQENATTEFHVFPCGGGIVRAKLRGPGIVKKKQVNGHESLKAPSLPPGKRYTLRVSATPQELSSVSTVKVVATQEGSIVFPPVSSKSAPKEFRSLRKCDEVTVGVEPAGAARYCILVRELRGAASLAGIGSIPDQCGLHRRRRSEYTSEKCEEKSSPPENRALPFTVPRLQPGKSYVVQITAQLKGQSLSYPLLGVRTKRFCGP